MKIILISTIISLIIAFFAVTKINMEKEREKNGITEASKIKVNVAYQSYEIPPIVSELNGIIKRRNMSNHHPSYGMNLGHAFQALEREGKATKEEVEAVVNFNKSLDQLSEAVNILNSIPSLRRQ